jgi:DNA mismatch endonuclease (patch repair protein)
MSRIRARDTKPELVLRRAMHHAGMRYRLHAPDLPGRPDMIMRRRKVAIFVHGCFWHAHDCPKGVTPATRRDFWTAKLARNRDRDAHQAAALRAAGWRVATVWECALAGRARLHPDHVVGKLADWLRTDGVRLEISGDWASVRARAPRGPEITAVPPSPGPEPGRPEDPSGGDADERLGQMHTPSGGAADRRTS